MVDLETAVRLTDEPDPLRDLAGRHVEDRAWPAALATWRKILVSSERRGDERAMREANLQIRALVILCAELDPVFAADAVAGMTSLLLLEAAYLGKPVLSLVPRSVEADWLWTIRMGHTPCARNRAEAEAGVRTLLARASDPAFDGAAGLPDPAGALSRYVGFFEARLAGVRRP